MRSSILLCQLLLVIFPTFSSAISQGSGNMLHGRFYEPPSPRRKDSSHITTSEQSALTSMPAPSVTLPEHGIACVPPLETFTVAHATISACPSCGLTGSGTSTNKSSSTAHNSQQSAMETFNVTFLNPDSRTANISCRLIWDTSPASPDKFPIANQMDCDKDKYNQLNAVVEKQTSGAAAGFYLFVWNK